MSEKKNIKIQKTADGRMVLFDEDRKVLGTQKMNKHNQMRVAQGKKPIDYAGITRYCWKNNKNSVPIFVQVEMDATNLPDDFQLFPKTDQTTLMVIQMVADGKTLRTIGQIPGMPPVSVVTRWCAVDEDFKDALHEARKSRAEVYHDAIEHVAFNAKETNARSSKVKIDALRFLAGVNDRDRFGSQTKVVGDADHPVSFIVQTGIADQQPIRIEGEVIDVEEERPTDNLDGVHPPPPPAGDPFEVEAVQCAGVPPKVR